MATSLAFNVDQPAIVKCMDMSEIDVLTAYLHVLPISTCVFEALS